MKKMLVMAMMMVMTISAKAMSYHAAKNEALFLSDKGTTRLTSVLGWVPGLRAQPHRCTSPQYITTLQQCTILHLLRITQRLL